METAAPTAPPRPISSIFPVVLIIESTSAPYLWMKKGFRPAVTPRAPVKSVWDTRYVCTNPMNFSNTPSELHVAQINCRSFMKSLC